MAAQGRDIKMSTSRLEGYQILPPKFGMPVDFCKYYFTNADGIDLAVVTAPVNKWIVSNIIPPLQKPAYRAYRFNEAADAPYNLSGIAAVLVCRLIKPSLSTDDSALLPKSTTISAILAGTLRLLTHLCRI